MSAHRITLKVLGGTNLHRYGTYADGRRATPRPVLSAGEAVDAALAALGATVRNPWDWDRHHVCLTHITEAPC